jgi:hypothetical protein
LNQKIIEAKLLYNIIKLHNQENIIPIYLGVLTLTPAIAQAQFVNRPTINRPKYQFSQYWGI